MRRVLGALGGFLGWLLWALHVRRRVVMDNLRLAFRTQILKQQILAHKKASNLLMKGLSPLKK